ncbi:MAG: PspC domain-containing protein, partial [Soonwooa sp.]
NKIKINGNTIEYRSNDDDHVRINGKRYHVDSADAVFDKLNIDKIDLTDLDINIKDGKKEMTIKASK